ATLGEQLIAEVSEEHAREVNRRPRNAAERRRECVKALLAGKLVDSSELGYDLDGHHVALMARGEGAEELVREVAKTLDRRLLCVQREEEAKWACWLGGTRSLAAEQVLQALPAMVPEGVFVTIGEPAEGLEGWRRSHGQAKEALPAAERQGRSVVCYADVALLAMILHDDLLFDFLHEHYLEPFERMRDGGKVIRETLRAYFAAGWNISSAAAALNVDRHTVRNRLGAVEELLGRSLSAEALNLQMALLLAD
ncbi:MAG: helix-turn-helix domain-containing protein, partial [Actinomycetota bacterium]|nr:helix-turn-helix domain-containing protein [Actinomycetota bacterium]